MKPKKVIIIVRRKKEVIIMSTLFGIFQYEKYRDEKTGFSGFVLKTDNGNVFCKGLIQKFKQMIPIQLYGNYETDKNGRNSFIFNSYNIKSENQTDDLSFLISLNIDGLTLKEADNFINIYKNGVINTIRLCSNAKSFSLSCPVKKQPLAHKIYTKGKRLLLSQDLFHLILSVGGNYASAAILEKKYENKALELIKTNPYKYGYFSGLSFKSCEYIAAKSNMNSLDSRRAEGVLLYSLKAIEDAGNCYATTEQLKKISNSFQSNTLLGKIPFEYIMSIAILNENFVINNDKIYTKSMYQNIHFLASNVKRLRNSEKKLGIKDSDIDECEKKAGIKLSESQRNAMHALDYTGIKIIRGGPGTGKTTLVNIIINFCKQKYPDMKIALSATTGCAAQNMAAKTNSKAETVHKMLGLQPYSKTELFATQKRTEQIYIIDEFSMADIVIAGALFANIPAGSLVILVGDTDQLPSVNPGNVLGELIDAGIPCFCLHEGFRQKSGSAIIENAVKVRNGDINLNTSSNDFTIWNMNNVDDAIELCTCMADMNNTQILSPLKKSSEGTKHLNNLIQNKLYHNNTPDKKIYGDTVFYIGTKIVMTDNNYMHHYFNGETGTVTGIDSEGMEIRFTSEKTLYIENCCLKDVELAYALTVHKAQGAEYDNVVILLTKRSSLLLTRNLLYTAITRAKKNVTIINVGDSLKTCILNVTPKRQTGLCGLLK